jgi:hypothetical protein
MTPTEFEFWKRQMTHATQVWRAKGLAHDPHGKTESQQDVRMFMQAYRGQQWDTNWAGLSDEELAVTPLFFSAANTFNAGLLARPPKALVFPRKPGQAYADGARLFQGILNYDIHELKMVRQWRRALNHAFYAPFGLIRHGFTPAEEHADDELELLEVYAGARPDKPWIRSHKIWDFRLDPLASTPDSDGDARWCAFRSLILMDHVRKNPNMIDRKDLQPTVSLEIKNDRGITLERAPEEQQLLEVWTIYDKTDRKWFQLTPGSEKPIREPDDWPLPWEDLPYDAIYFNEQEDTLFPEPYAHAIWPSVVDRNKLRTLAMELVKRMRKLVLLRRDALGEGEANKISIADLTEIIMVDGGPLNEAIAEVSLGGFDASLLPLDALLEQNVREALGQSQMDRAQRINVESAEEAARVGQGAATNAGRNQAQVEDFLSSGLRHYAQARRATMDSTEAVPILGTDDASVLRDLQPDSFFEVTPDNLAGEYDFLVQAGSSLPETPELRAQMALADLKVMSDFPELHDLRQGLIDYWNARQKNVGKVMQPDSKIPEQPQGGPDAEPATDPSQLITALRGIG